MLVYLDLNIFDRLEKIERLEDNSHRVDYQRLYSIIADKKITTAYSNAHLNDLFRGYKKNLEYTNGHLSNLKTLTNNLCICQYWGQSNVRWHYRDIFEFFDEKMHEWQYDPLSYDELFFDEPLLRSTLEMAKLVPLPPAFKTGYADPLFGIMFPLSKIHNNLYALQSDIYNFQNRLKSDYRLYKTFKSKLLTSLNIIKNNRTTFKAINPEIKDLPKHLELTDILDAYTPANKTSDNSMYSKVIDIFIKNDFAGYKSDGHFNNMFDDALHTFYAAHFDYFITNDDRCKYKAEKTFDKLSITTKVIKISEIDVLIDSL